VTADIEKAKGSPDSIRLMLAYLCIATDKEASLETKVGILTRFELTNQEIAKVYGSKIQSVKKCAPRSQEYSSKNKKNK